MTDLFIRHAKAHDLAEVLELIHALAAHHGDTATATLADLKRDAFQVPPWVTLIVAENKTELLGYVALCPLAQVQFGARGMDMHHLFVKPQARGQGVAQRLINAAIEHSKHMRCRYIMVGTHPDNAPAQEVYLAAGFSEMPPSGPRFRMMLEAD
jgi:ribosomal protein S18 acetylase RimI-like enzyme